MRRAERRCGFIYTYLCGMRKSSDAREWFRRKWGAAKFWIFYDDGVGEKEVELAGEYSWRKRQVCGRGGVGPGEEVFDAVQMGTGELFFGDVHVQWHWSWRVVFHTRG